jgi:predicted type IV restriction endonuclease
MKEEIDDALRNYAERVQRHVDDLQKWNEADVKASLIDPFLGALHWNPTDPNLVRHEFPVTMGSETKKVDYALMSGDTPICIVEAKAGEVDEVAARQALSYACNLNVRWALVTNGQRLCLYGVEFYTAENIKNALVMDITISPKSIDASLDSLEYLTKGTLDSEEIYNVFKQLNECQALRVFLESRKDDLIKAIAKWIEERWDKGSVDDASLLSSLESESVFGRVKIIKEKPTRQISPSCLTVVTAGDWKHRPNLGEGVFELKTDPSKRIDVLRPGPDVERQLEKLGLRLSTPGAFGGFYYNLRKQADLIKKKMNF